MIKTRFAPSPTGYLHIGGVRTALYSWLVAKSAAQKESGNGQFILRIEDTDLERSTKEATDAIIEGLSWLGLDWDDGPYYQSQRFERYNFFIDQLIAEDKAYKCYASKELLDALREEQMKTGVKPRYDANHPEIIKANTVATEHSPYVIRFRNPKEGSVVFTDHVRGRIEVANSELDDLIIRRTDGTPTYNFCVVIDDWDMAITHVIRGEDHINNTPRQINIYHALNAPVPEFAHCAMILGDDGAKLSKRHGAVNVMQYRDDGFLPKAILNYLVRLGWSHGDQEIFSEEEMISLFELDHINKAPSAFNTEKLRWLNNHYLKTEAPSYVLRYLQWHLDAQEINISEGPDIEQVISLVAERCHTLVELATQIRYFYHQFNTFDADAAKKHLRPVAAQPLLCLKEKLYQLQEWNATTIHAEMNAVLDELDIGMGKLGMPLRVAVTGGGQSPSIDAVVALLGKQEALERIDFALAFIQQRTAE